MHNDEPVLLDALERGSLIAEVGEAIAGCKPPQVFGVHGDWGLGKTSFLHQVQWYLTGDCPQQPEAVTKDVKRRSKEPAEDAVNGNGADKSSAEGHASTQRGGVYQDVVQAVWFDAWRYQNEPAPVVALLHEMRAQLSWRSRAAGSASRAAEVLTRGALLSLEELTKKIGFQYSKFRQASWEWDSENLAATLPSHTLREHLCEAIRQLLSDGGGEKTEGGEKIRRLVVFIDDVDRCEPEAAYRLLEGLKIYLTLDNCVFVLGMNQKAIEEAIAHRMRASAGDRLRSENEHSERPAMRAAAYMEKLCQNVWRLPTVRQPGGVLYDLLASTVDHPGVRKWIRRGIEATRQPCLPPNPRRLKGLANLIGRLSSQFPTQEDRGTPEDMILEAQCLLIVACIYQFHHDLHVRWELDPDLYRKMYDRCRGVDLDLPFLDSLMLPQQYPDHEDDRTTPTETPESTYPDPTQANVFWIQPLILHLGDRVPLSHFERYLRGTPT